MIKDNHVKKNYIDWKQGLSIALGVPLLILPSIGYFTSYLYSAAIFVWLLSIMQGFFQNIAYAEMAISFPNASGLPGYAQSILKDNGKAGQFIGGFSAWSYWLAWNPVMAIFSLIIGEYLTELVPFFKGYSPFQSAMITGAVVFSTLLFANLKGTKNSAFIGYALNVISLLPLIVISISPFISGTAEVSNITMNWIPKEWIWDVRHLVITFGIFGMAQWSACAWETAAMYGPEYKNPSKDTLKALFGCGLICLFIFILVQTSAIATLGIETLQSSEMPPLLLMAQIEFGDVGASASIVMLIFAMISIIQTGFLGSSRAMHSMAKEGNLPRIFNRTNKHGVPIFSMLFIIVFNFFLIMLKTPSAILAASSMGYAFANGISLFAYVIYKRKDILKENNGNFKAPKHWIYIALFFGLLNSICFVVGLIYLNSMDLGWLASIIGIFILLAYIPLYLYTSLEKRKNTTSLLKNINRQRKSHLAFMRSK